MLKLIKLFFNICYQLFFNKKVFLPIPRNKFFLNILIIIILIFKRKINIYADSFAFYRLIRQIKYYKLYKYIRYPLNLVTNLNEYKFYQKSIYVKTKKVILIKKNLTNNKYNLDYYNQKKKKSYYYLLP